MPVSRRQYDTVLKSNLPRARLFMFAVGVRENLFDLAVIGIG
jgi:hypothetical protein